MNARTGCTYMGATDIIKVGAHSCLSQISGIFALLNKLTPHDIAIYSPFFVIHKYKV